MVNDRSGENPDGGDSSQPNQPGDLHRRRAVKRVLAGSALAGVASSSLPASWARPVVQAVLLPVHAQTSEQNVEPDGDFAFPELSAGASSFLQQLIPTARAALCIRAGCARLTDGILTVFVFDDCCCYTGTGNIGETIESGDFEHVTLCSSGCGPESVELKSLTGSPGSRILTISIGGGPDLECSEVSGTCDCSALVR